MKHLSTPISFPESSPSVVVREIFKQMNLFFGIFKFSFRFPDKRADIQLWFYLIWSEKIHNPSTEKRWVDDLQNGLWTSSLYASAGSQTVGRGKGMTSSREYVHTRMNVHGRCRSNKGKHKKVKDAHITFGQRSHSNESPEKKKTDWLLNCVIQSANRKTITNRVINANKRISYIT
jgi:hypothetical protein